MIKAQHFSDLIRIKIRARRIQHKLSILMLVTEDFRTQLRVDPGVHTVMGEITRQTSQMRSLHACQIGQESSLGRGRADKADRTPERIRDEPQMQENPPGMPPQYKVTKQCLRVERKQSVIEIKKGVTHVKGSKPLRAQLNPNVRNSTHEIMGKLLLYKTAHLVTL